jgi:Holliday junction resolvasome RuvABC DNA-binding subunit
MSILERFYAFLAELFEPFRFLKHARERRLLERQEEREHQLELIDTMLQRVEKVIEHQKDAAIATAQANSKLAEGIVTWLEMFKNSAEAQANLGTATVRSEDEYSDEQKRELERLIKLGYPVNEPRPVQLQWLLENDEL